MTTKSHGTIIYYNSDGGRILRTVTADDVAALEQRSAELQHDLNYYMHGAKQDAKKISMLEQAYSVASAIMRSEPIGLPPRLVKEWREAVQAVEGER
ncbi:hypothetical protein KC887_01380 [Candidatus Kaiserbacteria bacterium]|nr:hypothetical protein [Candidatus Kaiserbacteria bacterium]